MSNTPNIINTQIVSEEWDKFWSDTSGESEGCIPKPVLVISQPFEAGSAAEIQLTKMMQACKLEPSDYNVLQLKEDAVASWHLLRDRLGVKTLVLLGIAPAQLGVSVQLMPHQVGRFNDCSWIPTASLEDLMQHGDIKNHVWNYGLKPVFIDKIYG